MPPPSPIPQDRELIRALGVPGLTANIINTTIGAGIFVLPATVAGLMGAAAPVAFVVCAVVMGLVVTSFALAGSRVSVSGGLYGYVETAFGRYVGFLAGALLFLNACLGISSVAAAFAGFVGNMFPFFGTRPGRMVLLLVVFGSLAFVNVRGVKSGARAVAAVTIAKLIPILVFIGIGVFFIRPAQVAWTGAVSGKALGESVLLLIFAFSGVEIALTPSGEVKNPARTVPRSIFAALAITTVIYIAIQFVAQGVLGAEMTHFAQAPLAEAASRFLGSGGRLLILIGAMISAFGFLTSDMLGSPRTIYAFGRDKILPAIFARVHPAFRTPYIAIVTYALITYGLAFSSTFEQLVIIADVTLLLLYLLCCAAAIVLIRSNVRSEGKPLGFPGATMIPLAAAVVMIWILTHGTAKAFAMTAAYLLIMSLLYFVRRRFLPATSGNS
jgi:amino acid transporter